MLTWVHCQDPARPGARLPPGFFTARRLPSFCCAVPTGSYFELGFVAALGTHAARPARAGAFTQFCNRQSLPLACRLLFLPTCLQGQEEGREGLMLLKCEFYSGADDTSRLKARADQGSQLRGAGLGRGGSAS